MSQEKKYDQPHHRCGCHNCKKWIWKYVLLDGKRIALVEDLKK